MIKAEESGNVILASYPELREPPPPSPIMPIPNSLTKSTESSVHRAIVRSKSKILIAVFAVVAIALTLGLTNYYNHSTSNMSAQQMLSDKKYALYNKGDALIGGSNQKELPILCSSGNLSKRVGRELTVSTWQVASHCSHSQPFLISIKRLQTQRIDIFHIASHLGAKV